MALLILALLQRIFLMSSLMLLLVWLIFFMVLIKLLPILGTISGKDRKSGSAGMPRPISYAVFCLKKKRIPGAEPVQPVHQSLQHGYAEHLPFPPLRLGQEQPCGIAGRP